MPKPTPGHKARKQTVKIVLIAVAVALAALSLYPLTHAGTFAVSAEAENGSTAGTATKGSVPGASGQAVLFGGGSGGPVGNCVAPSNNKLLDQDMEDTQHPWQRKGATKVVIYFETRNVAAEYIPHMEKGAAAWNRSPCLDVRLAATCPSGTNCVPSATPKSCGADGNYDEVVKGGYQVNGGNLMEMCTDALNKQGSGAKLNVTIHEMGHAVGLRHRLTERVLMNGDTYKDIFDPDATDMHNLLVLYGSQS